MTNSTMLDEGIYTPVPTFFKGKDYDLDLDTQVKHAKNLYDSGINGLVIAGSMGESIHLTRQERLQLLSAIRTAVPDDKFKLISGMPYTNIADTVSEIEDVKKNGGDYVVLLTPGYYGAKLTHQKGIADYFKLVGDKLKLPIVIYHYPGVSNGTDITTETFDELLAHPNIVGVKLTHFNMDKYILLTGQKEKYIANNFRPFTGLGQILVPSLAIGAYGAIDGLSGIFPKSMVKLYNLYKTNQFEEATGLQYLVTRANQMVFDINLVGVKYALHTIHGLGDVTYSARPPLNNTIDEKIWANYADDMNKLAKYEASL